MATSGKYIAVASVHDIESGKFKTFDVMGESIILINLNGEFYAYKNQCPHMDLDFNNAELNDEVLTCPWHGAQFNARTGAVLRLPASESLTKYEVKIEDDRIFVKI